MGAVIVPTIFAVVFFFGDPRNGSSSVIRRPGWPAGVSRDLWDVYNGSFIRYLPILIFLTLALCGLAVLSLAVIFVFSKTNLRSVNALIFLALSSVAAFLQMWIAQSDGAKNIVGDSDNTLYALQFVVVLFVIVALTIVSEYIITKLSTKPAIQIQVGVIAAGIFIVWSSRAWQIEFSPSYLIPLLTSLKPAIPFCGSLVVGIVAAIWYRSRSKDLESTLLKNLAVFSSMTLVISFAYIFFANYTDVSSRQQIEWRLNDADYRIRSDYLDATEWITSNSVESEVVAASATTRSPKLSEITNRKELAGFQITIRLAGLNSDFESERRQILFDFTSSGDCESADGLRANEVAYVLVDLTNPETPDVERCAEEVFRNETVIVYSLK